LCYVEKILDSNIDSCYSRSNYIDACCIDFIYKLYKVGGEYILLKHQLLDEMFAIGGNQDMGKIKEMKGKLSYYLVTSGGDDQVEDGLRMLEAFAIAAQDKYSGASGEIVAPMLARLSNTNEWDFYDIRLVAAVLGVINTADQAYEFAEKALEKLEKHSHEKRYTGIKLTIRVNTITRLLRAKYFDLQSLISAEELEKRFSAYVGAALAICDEGDFQIHKAVTTIRKGLFYQDNELTNKGFGQLKDTGADEVYRIMQESAEEFSFFVGLRMSRKQFDKIVGENIRKKRRAFGLTLTELAKTLEVSTAAVGLTERGERGATSFTIYRLSHIFDVSTDYFYQGIDEESPVPTHRKTQLKKLDAFVSKLTESELNYLILMAKKMPGSREE